MTDLQKCTDCGCMKLLSLFKVRENTGQLYKTCIKCRDKRYSKTVIYKLFCKDPEIKELYVAKKFKGDRKGLERVKVQVNDPPRRKNAVFLGGSFFANFA